ncbi:MAG: hypothetical protein KJ601_03390 [Nanoarchaeota archaeon]|nr:hypothetical protein [Nanoarchaeota archaeon]MBU1704442.1 hypothetical protein [Nanoarchaeota archaeon]
MKQHILSTIKLIKKNKGIFAIALLLQLIFFSSLAVASFGMLIPFTDKAKNIFEYIQNVKMDTTDEFTQFGDDPLAFYHDFKDAQKYLQVFGLTVVIILLTVNNMIWALARHIHDKMKPKEFFKYLLNFIIIKISALAILVFLFAELFKALLDGIFVKEIFISLLIAIVFYLMFVFIAATGKEKIMDIIDRGLKKLLNWRVLFAIVINLFLLCASWALFFKLGELSLIIVFILVLLLTFVYSWTKIFLISVLKA